MDWIQQWQSKLNKQNGVAPLVRTGGSRHTGLAALPYRNIQLTLQLLVLLFFLSGLGGWKPIASQAFSCLGKFIPYPSSAKKT